jgi:2-polyprenyl-3-methyl-5-hydroxy-6-metoxy-1,4-benzoquinol methylase
MKAVDRCPACDGRVFQPFSFTVESERNGAMHFAQTRCRDCDLVFANPVAEPDELERFYRAEYYEEHEQVYNANKPDLEQIIRDRALGEAEGLRRSVLPYVPDGRFFEIGAGHGALLAGARQLGFSVAGIEPSVHAASFAQDVLGLTEVRCGVFNAADWPAATCDVIYSFQVIEHVSNLHEFVGGIARMLKPGGLTIIGTENHHNAWVRVRRARSWLKGRSLPEFQTASHHTFYFSDRSLCRLVERHGLRVEKCLVYTPSLALKLPHYHFRHWYSKLGFYLLHYADEWTGRGGRLLVWCRKPPEQVPAAS